MNIADEFESLNHSELDVKLDEEFRCLQSVEEDLKNECIELKRKQSELEIQRDSKELLEKLYLNLLRKKEEGIVDQFRQQLPSDYDSNRRSRMKKAIDLRIETSKKTAHLQSVQRDKEHFDKMINEIENDNRTLMSGIIYELGGPQRFYEIVEDFIESDDTGNQ